MNSIQDLKLGTLQGLPAIIVLGALALTVVVVLIVILVNGIKAAKEHKNALEDKAENEFYAEFGITGAEMRLNERITAMQEQLTARKRAKKKNRTIVETQFVVVERAGEPVPTVVHSEEYADEAPMPAALSDANAQSIENTVYEYDADKEYDMPFGQYDDELVYDMPKSVYSYDDNLVYPMPPRESIYDDNYIYTIDNPVYEDIELASMPDMIDESDEPEMVDLKSLDQEAEEAAAEAAAEEEAKQEEGEKLVPLEFEKPEPVPTYDEDIFPPRPAEPEAKAEEAEAVAADEEPVEEPVAEQPAEEPVAEPVAEEEAPISTIRIAQTLPEEATEQDKYVADELEREAAQAVADAHAAAREAEEARKLVMEATEQAEPAAEQASEASEASLPYVAPIDQAVDAVTNEDMFDELFKLLGISTVAKELLDEDELPVTIMEGAEEAEQPAEEPVEEEPVEEPEVVEEEPEEVEEPVEEEPVEEEPVDEPIEEEPVEEEPEEEVVEEEPVEEEPVDEQPEEPVEEKKVVKLTAPFMPITTPKNERKEPQKPVSFDDSSIYGKYVIEHAAKEDGSSEYYFTLYGNSGKVLYESDNYTSLDYCKDAIKRFRAHVQHGVFTIDAADGRFFYVLTYKGFTYKGNQSAAFDEVAGLVKQVKNYYGTFVVREQ